MRKLTSLLSRKDKPAPKFKVYDFVPKPHSNRSTKELRMAPDYEYWHETAVKFVNRTSFACCASDDDEDGQREWARYAYGRARLLIGLLVSNIASYWRTKSFEGLCARTLQIHLEDTLDGMTVEEIESLYMCSECFLPHLAQSITLRFTR